MRRSAAFAVALPALAAAGLAGAAAFDHGHAPGPGRPAPALPKEVLLGSHPKLRTLRGRPVVVSFWASWCHPCRREAPELARFARRAPLGARVVAVAYEEGRSDALRFARRQGWRFPVLRDGDGRVGERFGVIGLPTTFIVDAQGRVRRELQGPQTVASLTQALRHAGARS